MATFNFELVSPERLLFAGQVESVIVPGSEGEMTVLAYHAPVMSTLKPGVVTIADGKGATRRLFVRGGFADIAPDGLTILAEQAIALEEVKADVLAADIRNAEEDLRDARTDAAKVAAADKLAALNELRRAVAN